MYAIYCLFIIQKQKEFEIYIWNDEENMAMELKEKLLYYSPSNQ